MAAVISMTDADDLAAWLRLSLTPGIGNQRARQLLKALGLPQTIFDSSKSALCAVLSEGLADALLESPPGLEDLLRTTCDWLDADPQHRRVLTLGDPAYPRCLLELDDPPLMLYAMGQSLAWEIGTDGRTGLDLAQAAGLAIVGSRNPTPQGAGNAHDFALALAQAGLTVVSGMALGIDAAAHRGALEAHGLGEDAIATVAVVGTGLDRVYPRQHRALAHQIARRGVILGEYHLGTPPLAAHFPQRNRLIAGLSRGTLVVEAALQSGSLITARMALERVQAALEAMDPTLREGFVLRVLESVPLEELAAWLGVSLATAKRRVSAAHEAFDAIATQDPRLSAWIAQHGETT